MPSPGGGFVGGGWSGWGRSRFRRLFEQAERLKAAFTTPILVVEGPSLYTYTKMSPQALQSALARIMVNPGVSFLRTDSKEDTAA